MQFNAQDKDILEHLTGKVPILLSAVVAIRPEQLCEALDGEFERTDGLPEDEYKQKAQSFYNLLYKATEVRDLVKRISVHAKKRSMALRDTDELLQ